MNNLDFKVVFVFLLMSVLLIVDDFFCDGEHFAVIAPYLPCELHLHLVEARPTVGIARDIGVYDWIKSHSLLAALAAFTLRRFHACLLS